MNLLTMFQASYAVADRTTASSMISPTRLEHLVSSLDHTSAIVWGIMRVSTYTGSLQSVAHVV